MHSTESSENYLETILILSKKLPVVRSVDIANELGFKKSSVSIAMKNLREKNQITVTDAGFIYLTDEGRAIAEMIYERHELLSKGLVALGVDPKVATEDACRIEHVISAETSSSAKRRRIIFPAGIYEYINRTGYRFLFIANYGIRFFILCSGLQHRHRYPENDVLSHLFYIQSRYLNLHSPHCGKYF